MTAGTIPKKIDIADGQEIRRFFEAEMRASGDAADMKVEGYALKFGIETVIGSSYWGWIESISKEAMKTADLSDVVFDFNHSFDQLLARTLNNSLDLKSDDTGLKITAKITDTATGRDVYAMIKDGLITKMSFWAVVQKSVWTLVEDGSEEMDRREITEFGRFYDVAAVTFPAYEDTEVTARSFAAETEARRKMIFERQIARLNKIMGGK
jgi:HK97 family phage prohead protease